VASNAPLDIRPEAQRRAEQHAEPNIDVIELQKHAHDRPKKGARIPSEQPKELAYDSIEELLKKNVTDRKNAACKVSPRPGEIPVLQPGKASNGCEYTNSKKDPLAVSIYKQHRDQTVQINAKSESGPRKGSGVIVGQEKDTCLVLTDAHVTNGLNVDKKVSSVSVITAAGEKFPATVKKLDPSHDLALLSVKTGAETERVCKPVKVAQDLSSTRTGEPLVTLGSPEYSTSVYASPGKSLGANQLINTFGEVSNIPGHPYVSQFSEVVRGEDTGRPVIEQNAQVYQGNSGGPTFNKAGELVGVLSRTKGPAHSLTTPVTASTIEALRK